MSPNYHQSIGICELVPNVVVKENILGNYHPPPLRHAHRARYILVKFTLLGNRNAPFRLNATRMYFVIRPQLIKESSISEIQDVSLAVRA